ncbi:transmembrane 220 family protein [Parapedobacter sp. ISTM3]|uniref:transmembrane 220 family protein n=1 Tax=Parapedobacter sp. ISTM3 TaxID=2800130 RepID=UPI001903D81B|nr:transmembrane 220 family protein [Parapedobacter sp. ISTM3]MBK1442629.1 transmembrane 220 family protein [Parapedobacter sp. ISTM3]
MKIFNGLFCALFVVSAALQYNDEDPFLWIPIYLYAAWLCYLAINKRYPAKGYLLGLVVYVGYAIYLLLIRHEVIYWFEHERASALVQRMEADQPWIEETRELGGLLILIIVLGINWIGFRKKVVTPS